MARIQSVPRFSIALLLSLLLDSSRAWVLSTSTNAGYRSSPRRGQTLLQTSRRAELWGTPSDDRGSGGFSATRCPGGPLIDRGEVRDAGTDRRKFVGEVWFKALTGASAMVGVVGSAANAASAADSGDILEQFGLGLAAPGGVQQAQRSSKWPRESPSPLPTRKKSAQELTRDPDPPSTSTLDAPDADADDSNDMAKALRDASRKKRIDPRTHG